MSDDPKKFSILKILHGALIAGVLAYGAIFYVLKQQATGSPRANQTLLIMTGIFAVLAFGSLVAAFVIRSRAIAAPRDDKRWARLFTAYILCWALCESSALYGFILGILSGYDVNYFAPFALASLVGLVLNAPAEPL